jgi:hypothetical protein
MTPPDAEHAALLDVLRVAADLDRLGDVLAEWAVERSGEPPDAAVDDTVERVGARLDALGVPREEGVPPRGRR